MPRIFASLLIFLMVFAFFSCRGETKPDAAGSNDTAETFTGEEDPAGQSYADTLPAADFEGYTFRIIAHHTSTWINFPEEEQTGEPVNDAMLRRNKALEERFNIKIENIAFDSSGPVLDNVKKSAASDDHAYDMAIASMTGTIAPLASSGMLRDLNSINHLRLDQNWWCKSMYENLQVGGRIFYTTGPISGFFFYAPVAICYNKQLAQDMGIGDIYRLVLNNEWTADKFFELIQDKSKDLDGDGAVTKTDFYALACDGVTGQAAYIAFGGRQVTADGAGYFKLNFEDEKTQNLINKAAPVFGDISTAYSSKTKGYTRVPGEPYPENTIFMENRALFIITPMGNVAIDFRAMESDFGILPLPKLDSSQPEYYSYGNPHGPIGIAVPIYCENAERTGLILETMAVLSYDLVRPAMYDNMLQQKIARDEDSQKMLDIIYENTYFDLNTIHNFGGSSDLLQNCMGGINENFASSYEKIKARAEKALGDLIGAYTALD
ncbi:MAG: hypothetical protein FWD23_12200 [Oscillospiraceae bacterium]|nr:hypothetical protein [Oscillospiraceae bacterium]